MEREKLRIECGVREIEVNDDGECIYIPMDDNTFFKRVDNFLNWLEERQATLEKEGESRPKLEDDTPEAKLDMIKEAVELQARLSDEVLYGAGQALRGGMLPQGICGRAESQHCTDMGFLRQAHAIPAEVCRGPQRED